MTSPEQVGGPMGERGALTFLKREILKMPLKVIQSHFVKCMSIKFIIFANLY